MFQQATSLFRLQSIIGKALWLILLLSLTVPPASSQGSGAGQEVTPLEIGKAIERELSGGERHNYDLKLDEGQYASVVVEQRGIDLLVRVLGVNGKPMTEFDSELRHHGPEPVEMVAESAGAYRVAVEAKWPKDATGRYEIRLVELRAATESDRSLQEARRLLADSVSLRRAGKYDQAIPPGERAIEIRESVLGSEHPDVAASLNNLGEVFRMKGDYTRTEQLYKRALEIREKALGPEHPDAVSSLNNLAILHYLRGKFDQAEQLYKRALEIREKVLGPEHRDVATTLNNMALVYRSKSDFDKAEQLFNRALEIREKVLGPEHPDIGPTLHNLAIVYRSTGSYDKAERLYKRALEIYEKALGPEHPNVASTLNNLGITQVDMGNYDKAEQLYNRALEIREKALGPEHPNVASTLHNLAAVYRNKGDFDKAEQLNQRAIKIAEKALGPEHPNVSEMLNHLAILYAAKGDLAQAITTQLRADKIIEHNIALNLVAGSERQKLAYQASLSEPTDRTLSLHTRSAPDSVEARGLAATTILRRKVRVLDALADSLKTLRQRFSQQDQKLLDQLNDTIAQLAGLVLNGPQRMTPAEHQARIKSLEAQREELEAEISRRSAEFRAASQPVTLAAVQAAIPANAALIELAVYRPFDPKAKSDKAAFGESRYVAYIIRKQSEVQWKELGEARAIDGAIEELRKALRDPKRKDIEQLARAVDEKIMRPVRPLLGDATHLLVSPDGALNLIPFEALVDEQNRFLIERYSFNYLTSGRDLLRLQVARNSPGNPLVLADPSFGEPETARIAKADTRKLNERSHGRKRQSVTTGNDLSHVYFAPLDGTQREARTIKSLFPEVSLLTRSEATEAHLKQVAAPRLLHIATHGFFLSDGPTASDTRGTRAISASAKIENPLLRSGLALAGANLRSSGTGDDGILTALEASGLNLWGTKLVVLSACDTGVGEVKNGEGVYGLRRALVLAGAETLVMSLWPVSDYVTREMMTAYYKGLKQGQGRGEALREVQLSMLKHKGREHPFYWASFIQSGEWANLEGKR